MALSARVTADQSALSRMRHAAVANILEPLILAGEVGTSASSSSRLSTARSARRI